MKRVTFLLSCLVIALLVPGVVHSEETVLLKAPGWKSDWGVLEQNQAFSAKFELENASNETITIKGIRAVCSCTVPELAKKVLRPGEKVPVSLLYDTANKAGESSVRLYIAYQTSSNEGPLVMSVAAKVKVVSVITVVPRILDFGIVTQGESYERQVKMAIRKDRKYKWAGSRFDDPVVSVEMSAASKADLWEAQQPSPDYDFMVVKVRASFRKSGMKRSTIFLRYYTESGDMREMPIPVMAYAAPDVSATPSQLFGGYMRAGQPLRGDIIIKSAHGNPCHVAEVLFKGRDANGLLEYTATIGAEGTNLHVEVTFDEAARGTIAGELEVRFARSDGEDLVIPVVVVIAAQQTSGAND